MQCIAQGTAYQSGSSAIAHRLIPGNLTTSTAPSQVNFSFDFGPIPAVENFARHLIWVLRTTGALLTNKFIGTRTLNKTSCEDEHLFE